MPIIIYVTTARTGHHSTNFCIILEIINKSINEDIKRNLLLFLPFVLPFPTASLVLRLCQFESFETDWLIDWLIDWWIDCCSQVLTATTSEAAIRRHWRHLNWWRHHQQCLPTTSRPIGASREPPLSLSRMLSLFFTYPPTLPPYINHGVIVHDSRHWYVALSCPVTKGSLSYSKGRKLFLSSSKASHRFRAWFFD